MRRQMATGVLSSDGELRAVIVLYDLLFLQRVEGGTFAVEEEMRMQGLGKILACISVLMAYFMRRKMIARVHVENHPMLELLRKAGWVKRRGLVGFLLRPLDLIARETTLEPGDWDTLVANSARYLEEVRAQAGFDFQHKIFVSEHLWRRVVLLAHGRFAV